MLLLAHSIAAAQTTPAADPFTRDGKPAAPAGNDEPATPANIYGLMEYIEVPASDWMHYVDANPLGHDVQKLRAEVQRWITSGKAKPIEMVVVPTRSGNRTVIESVLERRSPYEYVLAEPNPVPTSFVTRNTHLTFEWEPIALRSGNTIISQCASQLVTNLSEIQKSELRSGAGGGAHVPFGLGKPSVNDVLKPDVPSLYQVTVPAQPGGQRREDVRQLCFFRCAIVPAPAGQPPQHDGSVEFMENGKPASISGAEWRALQRAAEKDPSAKKRVDEIRQQIQQYAAVERTGILSLEIQRLEVKLGDLNKWFSDKPLATSTAGLFQAAREWIGNGRGRKVDLQVSTVRSGFRSVTEDVHELTYPNQYYVEGVTPPSDRYEMRPPKPTTFSEELELLKWEAHAPAVALKNPVIGPQSNETRNTGFTVEVEPVLAVDGRSIEVALAVNDIRHLGQVVHYQREAHGKVQSTIEHPLIGAMKVTTNVAVTHGVPALLAIHTPVGEDLKPNAEARILTFITIRE